MGWRSVMISQPAYLSLARNALQIRQDEQHAQIPLEDISVIVLDNVQATLTAQLLRTCADQQIVVISTGADHHPNGVFIPYVCHSRALKVMRSQLALGLPRRKQLHQQLVQQKLRNQAACLQHHTQTLAAKRLLKLAGSVRSGDPDNLEAQGALAYFRALFGSAYTRRQDRFHNAALNFSYAVLRATIARTLVSYGFLPAFGLFHDNEQNSFNLADDLIEPFRALADWHVLAHFPEEPERELSREDKAKLLALLGKDIVLETHEDSGACTVLAAIEQCVESLTRAIGKDSRKRLSLPCLQATLARQVCAEEP